MNARYFLPSVGRFISADSIVPNPINPQSWNRYSYVLNSPTRLVDPSGHGECDINKDCLNLPELKQEKRSRIPSLIKGATPFTNLPFDISGFGNGFSGVQGFGDPEWAATSGLYQDFGYLHPGIDLPMDEGTALLALGDGYVWCGSEKEVCGQGTQSGGHGIGIYYYSCDCVVYYIHAIDVLPKYTADGTRVTVSAGDIVGYSGSSKYVEDGVTQYYPHLHLEIRNVAGTMVYNPIYFFDPDTWNSMNISYDDWAHSYPNPETRIYAIEMGTGFNYWNWIGDRPFVLVR